MLTDEKLRQIEAIAKEASPGPWHAITDGAIGGRVISSTGWCIAVCDTTIDQGKKDANFIALARADTLGLTKECRRLKKLLSRRTKALTAIEVRTNAKIQAEQLAAFAEMRELAATECATALLEAGLEEEARKVSSRIRSIPLPGPPKYKTRMKVKRALPGLSDDSE